MDIVLVSHNKKKLNELRALLSTELPDINVLSPSDVGLTDDIEENGSTFEENALIKARAAAGLGYIAVADDSGLMVDALGGEPGIYSARYSGEHGNDSANNELLLNKLEGVPYEDRTARFVSVIACVDGTTESNSSFTVCGICDGIILESPIGANGFGYDPLFWYPNLSRSFAQLTDDEKNIVSHRGQAMRRFADEFVKRYGNKR